MLLKSFLYVRAVALYYLSLKGLRAEPAFKFFDLMHEGWWRDAETQGGAGEVLFLGGAAKTEQPRLDVADSLD